MKLNILRSNVIASSVSHGFFSRKGGVSNGIYQSLNCGYGSTDGTKNVQLNRKCVAANMGLSECQLVSVNQTHSTQVVTVHGTQDIVPQGDAMVTRQTGLALAILTADCQPVLFCEPQTGVIGAAHAGWRGALAGVLETTLDAMIDLGARRNHICAAIGPSISQKAYEVGPDLLEKFLAENSNYNRFFAAGTGDRLQFDLIGFSLYRLRRAGVKMAEWTGHCSYSDPENFFSYRRSMQLREADYGRMISVIKL